MEELKVNKEVNRTEVESLAQESKKVTDEKIEKSLNYDLLSQEEKAAKESVCRWKCGNACPH